MIFFLNIDIDECAAATHNCSDSNRAVNGSCQNLHPDEGKYNCSCEDGFEWISNALQCKGNLLFIFYLIHIVEATPYLEIKSSNKREIYVNKSFYQIIYIFSSYIFVVYLPLKIEIWDKYFQAQEQDMTKFIICCIIYYIYIFKLPFLRLFEDKI